MAAILKMGRVRENLVHAIVLGTTGIGRYFSVQEATPFPTLITGNVQLEDSFDLSILNENPTVPVVLQEQI